MLTHENILFLQHNFFPIVVRKQMAGLPPELQNIVWDYLISFHKILRLPRLRAIKRLVQKSNYDIMSRFIFLQSVYPDQVYSYYAAIALRNIHPVDMPFLVQAVVDSLRFNLSSSGLRWVFLDQGLFTVREYFLEFKTSLIFQVFYQYT